MSDSTDLERALNSGDLDSVLEIVTQQQPIGSPLCDIFQTVTQDVSQEETTRELDEIISELGEVYAESYHPRLLKPVEKRLSAYTE